MNRRFNKLVTKLHVTRKPKRRDKYIFLDDFIQRSRVGDYVGKVVISTKYMEDGIEPKYNNVCDVIARYGCLSLLKWCLDQPESYNATSLTYMYAAHDNQLEIIQWLRKNAFKRNIAGWAKHVCHRAALRGHFELLKWCKAYGAPWDEYICGYAALGGYLNILKWCRENGASWTAWTCANAALNGDLETLQYCIENGCPYDADVCARAAEGGHLNVLKWWREKNFPWDRMTCYNAAREGYLNILKWCAANGMIIHRDDSIANGAAYGGHLHILEWCRENNYPLRASTCAIAADGGHLRILMWCRENDVPWDERTCSCVAECGGGEKEAEDKFLPMLIWARENGCPWDEETCFQAARNGYLKMLKWCRSPDRGQPCPWNIGRCLDAAINHNDTDVAQWIQSQI